MKRTGTSKKTNKQYTYYCCEYVNSRNEESKCDFMTWDVPMKDDCPVCGHTMFKKPGKGFKKPYCINEACANFVPEDQRGYKKKTAAAEGKVSAADEKAQAAAEEKKPAAKKAAAKKTTAKKTTAKKSTTTKTAAKKTTAKKAAATETTG